MAIRELTLPDSGATVRVKRISPMTILAIEQANPDPKPPLQDVDYGNGKTRLERNPHDPAYQDELAAHANRKNLTILRAFVKLGVECEVDPAAVAAYRAAMNDLGAPLDADDKYVYVAHILCETASDLNALRQTIESASVPTEPEVAQKLATFQSDLPGNGPVSVEGAA